MARPLKPLPREHTLAAWIRQAGYSRRNALKVLDIPECKYVQYIMQPAKYLSIRQLMMISGMVQRPFIEVLFAALRPTHLKQEIKKRWYEETGIGTDEITEPKG